LKVSKPWNIPQRTTYSAVRYLNFICILTDFLLILGSRISKNGNLYTSTARRHRISWYEWYMAMHLHKAVFVLYVPYFWSRLIGHLLGYSSERSSYSSYPDEFFKSARILLSHAGTAGYIKSLFSFVSLHWPVYSPWCEQFNERRCLVPHFHMPVYQRPGADGISHRLWSTRHKTLVPSLRTSQWTTTWYPVRKTTLTIFSLLAFMPVSQDLALLADNVNRDFGPPFVGMVLSAL
jgi:hypothetical protein